MRTTILFPCSYFEHDKPDDVFSAEHRAALASPHLDVRLCNFDEFDERSVLRLDARSTSQPPASGGAG